MVSAGARWGAAVLVASALTLSGCTFGDPSVEEVFDDLSQVRAGDDLWQGDAQSCVTGSVDTDDPDVSSAMAVAMGEDAFWELIAVLDGGNAEEDVARLSAALAARTVEDMVAFDARLTLALYALDDQCHLVDFRDSDRWDGGWVNGDAFLYARADTVAAGRRQWESAMKDGELPAGTTEPMNGELLLYAALDASIARGMGEFELWDLEWERYSLSYESGSNPTGWPNGAGKFIVSTEDLDQ